MGNLVLRDGRPDAGSRKCPPESSLTYPNPKVQVKFCPCPVASLLWREVLFKHLGKELRVRYTGDTIVKNRGLQGPPPAPEWLLQSPFPIPSPPQALRRLEIRVTPSPVGLFEGVVTGVSGVSCVLGGFRVKCAGFGDPALPGFLR